MEVAAFRGKAGEQQDGLAFDQATNGEDPVAVGLDQRTEIDL
jgi:hypothetical protein